MARGETRCAAMVRERSNNGESKNQAEGIRLCLDLLIFHQCGNMADIYFRKISQP